MSGFEDDISSLKSKMQDILKVQTFTGPQTTVNTGTSAAINFTVTAPSGYTRVGTVGFYTASEYIFPIRITGNRMDVRNYGQGNYTITPTITVLFVKNGMI